MVDAEVILQVLADVRRVLPHTQAKRLQPVAVTDPAVADYAVRQRLLTDALERDLSWAYALGFSDSEIQQSVAALLSRTPRARARARDRDRLPPGSARGRRRRL